MSTATEKKPLLEVKAVSYTHLHPDQQAVDGLGAHDVFLS